MHRFYDIVLMTQSGRYIAVIGVSAVGLDPAGAVLRAITKVPGDEQMVQNAAADGLRYSDAERAFAIENEDTITVVIRDGNTWRVE